MAKAHKSLWTTKRWLLLIPAEQGFLQGMMKVMLLVFLSIIVLLSCASKPKFEKTPYFLVRDQTSGPSSKADPFILISYDVVQYLDLAHFRPASEILDQNLEILILDNCVPYFEEGPLMVKEISEVKIPADRIDTVFKASIIMMEHPVVTFSKMPGDHGLISQKLYTCCKSEDEGCTSLYVRTGKDDSDYVFVFDSENSDNCVELSNCSLQSHIDLFRKVYNVRMNGPKYIKDTCALCFYVFAKVLSNSNVSLAFQLLEGIDSPEIFWDFLKEYIRNPEKFPTISRIFIKKYPGMGMYQMIIRLAEMPDDKILDSIKSALRSRTGPCSSFIEGVSKSGLNLYQSLRFNYSPITLCALSLGNKIKGMYTVSNKTNFMEAMAKIKGEAGLRMVRTFPDIRKTEFFHSTVECPKFDRKKVFEQFACALFFADSKWTDCLASIELRISPRNLVFNAFFYLVKYSEVEQIQRDMIRLGKDVFQELTGKKTGGRSGLIFDAPLLSKEITIPKRAETTTPINDRASRMKPSLEKKCAYKRKTPVVKEQKILSCVDHQVVPIEKMIEDSAASTETNSTNPTALSPDPFEVCLYDVVAFGPIIKATEAEDIPSKALIRPEGLSQFESWVYDLTEEEFDNLLSDFEKRLSPFYLTNLNNLPSRISI